jgi:RNA polymerase sigma factor (sigma-70 family)
VDVEELESDAYLGLLKAARTFDPHRGVLFRTYAAKRIFGAMLDGLRERGQCRLRYPRPHIDSLDIEIPCGDGRTIRLSDTIASDDEPVGSALEIREEAEHLLRQLEPRSRRYLRDNTLRGLMQKEIARRECVSPARISQRMKAIHKELAELRSEHARAA